MTGVQTCALPIFPGYLDEYMERVGFPEASLLDPNQRVAREMRKQAVDWAELYGVDGGIPIEDAKDLWVQEQLGMVEPITADESEDEDIFGFGDPFGSGGGGTKWGRSIPTPTGLASGRRPRNVRGNYSATIGLVNWRI